MQKLLCCLILACLYGCTSFPPKGRGGAAEHDYTTMLPLTGDEPLGPEHGLRFEWELAARHLDVLILDGAQRCFPATVSQALTMKNRIARELRGGLTFDAANDLIIQRNTLQRLEKQLDALKGSGACERESHANSPAGKELIDEIHKLLNVDNQFAFNSPEINPKYLGHLADAAYRLRDFPQYNLHITGHADSVGSAETNMKLSLARAQQVQRYLEIFGFPKARITIAGVGSADPLFAGNETPHFQLVNRRVSIELVEAGKKGDAAPANGGDSRNKKAADEKKTPPAQEQTSNEFKPLTKLKSALIAMKQGVVRSIKGGFSRSDTAKVDQAAPTQL